MSSSTMEEVVDVSSYNQANEEVDKDLNASHADSITFESKS